MSWNSIDSYNGPPKPDDDVLEIRGFHSALKFSDLDDFVLLSADSDSDSDDSDSDGDGGDGGGGGGATASRTPFGGIFTAVISEAKLVSTVVDERKADGNDDAGDDGDDDHEPGADDHQPDLVRLRDSPIALVGYEMHPVSMDAPDALADLAENLISRLSEIAILVHPALAFPVGLVTFDDHLALVFAGELDPREIAGVFCGADFLHWVAPLDGDGLKVCLGVVSPQQLIVSASGAGTGLVCCWGLAGVVEGLRVDRIAGVAPELVVDAAGAAALPTRESEVFTLATLLGSKPALVNRLAPSDRGTAETWLDDNPANRPDLTVALRMMLTVQGIPAFDPAQLACQRDDHASLRELLDSGRVSDRRRVQLLDVASLYGSLACVNVLLGAGVSAGDGRPVREAASRAQIVVIERLLAEGTVKVTAADFEKCSDLATLTLLLDHFEGDNPASVGHVYLGGREAEEVDTEFLAVLLERGFDLPSPTNAAPLLAEKIEVAVRKHEADAAFISDDSDYPSDNDEPGGAGPIDGGSGVGGGSGGVGSGDESGDQSGEEGGGGGGGGGGGSGTHVFSSPADGGGLDRGEYPSWVHLFTPADLSHMVYLGKGAFGSVSAELLHGHTPVAVKRFARPDSDKTRRALFHELASHIILSLHPHTVSMIGLVVDNAVNSVGIVCELLPGGDLADWLTARRETPVAPSNHALEAAAILRGVADGLIFLHSKRLVHRDVKPANIFLSGPFTAKIGDFGLTSPIGGGEGWTRQYAAPEVMLRNALSTAASDRYSFALVVYEVLTLSKLPSEEARAQRWHATPWEVNNGLPEPVGWWADLVRPSLSPEQGARPRLVHWLPVLSAIMRTSTIRCSRLLGMCATGQPLGDVVDAVDNANGADPETIGDTTDALGRSALHHVAASAGSPDLVSVCVMAGYAVDAISNDGNTPLMVARSEALVRALVDAGADPNHVNTRTGDTALLCASKQGRGAVVAALLDAGADPTIANKAGMTAVDELCRHPAAAEWMGLVLALLVERGVRPKFPDAVRARAEDLLQARAGASGEQAEELAETLQAVLDAIAVPVV